MAQGNRAATLTQNDQHQGLTQNHENWKVIFPNDGASQNNLMADILGQMCARNSLINII